MDLNLANVEAFEHAVKDILGEYGCMPMVAYGSLKTLAAFKMLCRARNVEANMANEVSNQIKLYEKAVKYAIENNSDDPDYNVEDDVDIANYVDNEYMELIQQSRQYQGIYSSISPHPCGHLIIDGDIRKEIGVISLKPKPDCTERTLCAYIDGTTADAFGYVKMDLLRVDVVKMIKEAFDLAGKEVMSSSELVEVTKNDDEVWKLYANGLTIGLNQCEKDKSTEKCMRYKPRNIVELSAFIAGIRPGFKTQIDTLLSRKRFKFGIPILDRILQSPSRPDSFIEFDEDIMHIAQESGISGADSYALIKAVKKKKADKVKHYKDQLTEGFKLRMMSEGMQEKEATDIAEKIWKIVEGSASYLFNLAHAYAMALDSLYGAYLKAHYPYAFYLAMLKLYDAKRNKEKIVAIIREMSRYKGIQFIPGRLGQDNRNWDVNVEDNTISQSLSTVKYISKQATKELYDMRDIEFETFCDCLLYMQRNTSLDTRQVAVLIGIGYFSKFGNSKALLEVQKEFVEGKNRITKTHKDKTTFARLEILKDLEAELIEKNEDDSAERLRAESEYIGFCYSVSPNAENNLYIVQDVDVKYSPKVILYSAKRGTTGIVRVNKKKFEKYPLKKNDIIYLEEWDSRQKSKFENGRRKYLEGYDIWMTDYKIKEI